MHILFILCIPIRLHLYLMYNTRNLIIQNKQKSVFFKFFVISHLALVSSVEQMKLQSIKNKDYHIKCLHLLNICISILAKSASEISCKLYNDQS